MAWFSTFDVQYMTNFSHICFKKIKFICSRWCL